jgi:hypothetical protein
VDVGAGMEWIWLPLENGKPPEGEAHRRLAIAQYVLFLPQ